MAHAFDDNEPELWVPGEELPQQIVNYVRAGGTVGAHGAAFEYNLWNLLCVNRYGWPTLAVEQLQCTMAMALAMSLPAGLGDCARALGLKYAKDDAGRRLMLQMCKPRRIEDDGTLVWWDDEPRLRRLGDYCKQDVRVEQALARALRPLPPKEQAIYVIDQKINNRGIQVDIKATRRAKELVDAEKRRLDARMSYVTGGAVPRTTAVKQLTEWVKLNGVDSTSVAKADVAELLKDPMLPRAVATALRIRQEAGKSSPAKLTKLLSGTCADGRIRGLYQYHGASTGRWAGRRAQTQNLPRPMTKQEQIEYVVDRLLLDTSISIEDVATRIDNEIGDVLPVVTDVIRALFTAAPGCALIAADFSAIEARGLAWLAGEEAVLDVFRGHGKIYELAASVIFGVRLEDVTPAQRAVGKVAVLALGYQGGVGAFQQMARGYGVHVSDEEAEKIKVAWRSANRNIVGYWYAVERAAIEATQRHGTITQAGPDGRRVMMKHDGKHLWLRLPSGRLLCYPFASVDTRDGYRKLRYMGVDSTRGGKWIDIQTYGGKLVENITQAFCRDLQAEAMLRLEERGYHIVMHVHDEVVCEVKRGEGSLEEVEALMAVVPDWAKDMPIKAEGWIGMRYRK